MTTERFSRPLEIAAPRMPRPPEVELSPPVELPKATPGAKWRLILPLVMVVAMGGMVVMMMRNGGGFNPMMMLFPVMMLGSMGGLLAGGGGGGKKTSELNEDRKDYMHHLAQAREKVLSAAESKHLYDEFWFPAPELLPSVCGTPRQWGSVRGSDHALVARVGLGRVRSSAQLTPPEGAPTEHLDPLGMVAVSKFLRTYNTVADSVVTIETARFPAIGFTGDRNATVALVRAMVCQLAVANGPNDLWIVGVVDDPDGEWSWLKWLPHTQHISALDGAGSARMIYRSASEFTAAVDVTQRSVFSGPDAARNDQPHIVVICDMDDTHDWNPEGRQQVTYFQLGTDDTSLAASSGVVFDVTADGHCEKSESARGFSVVGQADALDRPVAETIARRLSRFRVDSLATAAPTETPSTGTQSWVSLIGQRDPGQLDLNELWKPYAPKDRRRLAIPFGYSDKGRPIVLDIKESNDGGQGPHGMLIGATGSGKSEFLRTMVMSLVTTHSPDEVNLVLVDFKGGAAFDGMQGLHHVAAVITNMDEERDLVVRLRDVIDGEVTRRMEVLRAEGNRVQGKTFQDGAEYEEFRQTVPDNDLTPFPALFIVIDEFTELLEQYPDFAETFVTVGRQGRSLWIHLLLATQRFDEGRTRGLESHLSYRIALKTFSAQDSRLVIGAPNAFHLPQEPGAGFLYVNNDLQRFQASYTGGSYVPALQVDTVTTPEERRVVPGYVMPQLFSAHAVPMPELPAAPEPDVDTDLDPTAGADVDDARSRRTTVMGTVINQLNGQGRRARAMWLPPINPPKPLDVLVPTWAETEANDLRFPMAIMDEPRAQRQSVWGVDTADGGGHVAIIGGTQMGKSTALQTMVLAAAATHRPEAVQFFCMDFSGGQISALRGLPHVSSVGRDVERVRRTLAVVLNILDTRETLFDRLQISSMRDFRARKAAGDPDLTAADQYGDVYLVVDGYDTATDRDTGMLVEEIAQFQRIATTGLNYGVHLVITASKWIGVHTRMKDLFTSRIELRLGDPTETELGRRTGLAADIPDNQPGRAISKTGYHMKIVLPRLDGDESVATIPEGLAAAVEQIAAKYPGRRAPQVELLPTRIDIAELEAMMPASPETSRRERLAVPFGVRESTLGAAAVNFERSAHMVVYGSAQSGKSTTLASIVESIIARTTTDEAKIVLIDYRRTHMELITDETRSAGYLTNALEVEAGMKDLAMFLDSRMPPADVTSTQLKERSWWTGPDVFLVVDDYSMVVQPYANPLDPIAPYLARGRDIGFHLIAARAIQGASAAINDRVLGMVKSLSGSGLLLDGDRLEGMLVDSETRPAKQRAGRGIFIEPTAGRKDVVHVGWAKLSQD